MPFGPHIELKFRAGHIAERLSDAPGQLVGLNGDKHLQLPAPYAATHYCVKILMPELSRITFFVRREGQDEKSVVERAKQGFPDSEISEVSDRYSSLKTPIAAANAWPMHCYYLHGGPFGELIIWVEEDVVALKDQEEPLEDWQITMVGDCLAFLNSMKKDAEEYQDALASGSIDPSHGSGYSEGLASTGGSSSDNRSNSLNPNNPAYGASNRANQMNPNNSAYRSSRGGGRKR